MKFRNSKELIEKKHLKNLKYFLMAVVVFYAIIIAHLFRVQIIKHQYYLSKANAQSSPKKITHGERGVIYDRKGIPLAINTKSYTYCGVPWKMNDTLKIANIFSQFTGKEKSEIIESIKKRKNFVYLARKIKEDEALKIDHLLNIEQIEGVFCKTENTRHYPMKGLASQVIGYTNIDNKGIEGIEYRYNNQLSGEDGYSILLRDAKGNNYELPDRVIKKPKDGCDIYTTIDIDFQYILEDELQKALKRLHSELAIGIIMHVKTNEVLAMATMPSFNPNSCPREVINENHRNRAITDMYEPGSTFKIFPAAAALIDHIHTEEELVYGNEGTIEIAGEVIHDLYPSKWITLKEIIQHSSNIGIIKIAQKLEKQRFYEHLRLFGFGSPTGIDLPGETSGLIRHPKKWSARSAATISIGQEIAITPIQLINAYNGLISDGNLYEPVIIKKLYNKNMNKSQSFTKQKIRRIAPEKISKQIISYLISVVENGTGRKASMQYLPVAGKTGTAQYVDPHTGEYFGDRTIPSFIGFLPADDPVYSCLIFIKNPGTTSNSGGTTAAPIFRKIFRRIYSLPNNELQHYLVKKDIVLPITEDLNEKKYSMDITKFYNRKKNMISLPSFKQYSIMESSVIAKELGLKVLIYGEGLIYKQQPRPGSKIRPGKTIVLYARNNNTKKFTSQPIKLPENHCGPEIIAMPTPQQDSSSQTTIKIDSINNSDDSSSIKDTLLMTKKEDLKK